MSIQTSNKNISQEQYSKIVIFEELFSLKFEIVASLIRSDLVHILNIQFLFANRFCTTGEGIKK